MPGKLPCTVPRLLPEQRLSLHHIGSPGLLPQEPAAVFSGTRGASVLARPVLINLLACLGRGLERGEEGKEAVEGKERKKPKGRRRVRRGGEELG